MSRDYAWCCFTCQQAAEKALKAILNKFRSGASGHNLNDLRRSVEQHVIVSQEVSAACNRLNRFYIPTRYPDAFPSGAPADQYDQSDATQCVSDAEEVLNLARSAI